MMKIFKRVLPLLLVLVMLIGILPLEALADDGGHSVFSDVHGPIGAKEVPAPQETEPATWKITYKFTGDVPASKQGKEPVDDKVYTNNQPYQVDTTMQKGNTVEIKDEYGNVIETYTFQGWDTEDGSITGNMTIKGEWKKATQTPATYTVTYADGVEDDKVFADEIHENVTDNSPTPAFEKSTERKNYTFSHWTSSIEAGSFTAEDIAAKKVTQDVTYTAHWTENTVTIRYVVANNEGGTVSRQNELDERVLCVSGEAVGATATAKDDVWQFINWTLDDGTEISEATLTPELVAQYAKKDGVFQETTFTAHFARGKAPAKFYYQKNKSVDPNSNSTGDWSPSIGEGLIDLDGIDFPDGLNHILGPEDSGAILSFPEPFTGGEVPRDNENWDIIKNQFAPDIPEDEIKIVLVPYKISDNTRPEWNDGYHVDCLVQTPILDHYEVAFWLWDAGQNDYQRIDYKPDYLEGSSLDVPANVNKLYETKKDSEGRPYHLSSWYMNEGRTGNPVDFTSYTVNGNVDFYAKYIPDYFVAYDLNGGTMDSAGIAKTYYSEGARVTVVSGEPTREGYTFAGWTTGDGRVVNGTFNMPDNDVTLVAQWTENTVAIRYVVANKEGGTVSRQNEDGTVSQLSELDERVLCVSGQAEGTTATAEDEGWQFINWTLEDGTEIKEATLTPELVAQYAKKDGVFQETTFTAHFARGKAPAKFYYQKNKSVDPNSNAVGDWSPSIGEGLIDLDGMEFDGINHVLGPEDSGVILSWPEPYMGGVVPRDNENWNIIKNQFAPDIPEDEIKIVLIPYKISDNTYANDGYHVDCLIQTPILNRYEVAFWLWDAGQNDYQRIDYKPDYLEGSLLDVPANVSELYETKKDSEGRPYHLSSWYMNEERTGNPVDFTSYTVNGNVAFYAKYIPDYFVAYDLNGGTMDSAGIAKTYYSEGAHVTLVSGEPTREGYTFAGWTTGDVNVVNGTFNMPDNDVTLVAQWKAIDYRLYYDANGGNENSVPKDNHAYHITDRAPLSAEVPTHEDADDKKVVFIGWTAAPDATIYTKDGTEPATIDEVTFGAGDITVYAVWGYDEDGDDIPDVTERKLTITADNATLVYNGMPQAVTIQNTGTRNVIGYTAEGLAQGDTITALTYNAEGTDAGSYAGTFGEDLVIENDRGEDVTDTYFVTYTPGTLIITPATLTITTPDATKTYDGKALTAEADVGITGFVNEETATFTVTGTQTEAGSSDNSYSLAWDGTAKESNYTLSETLGTLEVTPATLTITTPSATKLYDGEALTAIDGASITGFVNEETATFTVTGTQTEAGSSDNTYSLAWDGTAKESNYTVNETVGTLKVEAAHRLTVNYIYADGTTAAETFSEILPVDEEYRVDSPEIEGFTANTAFISGTMGGEDVTWTVTYTAVPVDTDDDPAPAPAPAPAPPVVVDTPAGPIEADANPNGGVELDTRNYTLIPVDDNGTPLANLGLDGHVDCALHFILILAAMLVVIAYTRSMKKHQQKIQELTEELELEKKHRGASDGSGEKE